MVIRKRGCENVSFAICPVVLLLLLAVALPVFAQNSTGTILGVVKDAQGGAVAGATVTIHNTETGLTRSLTTGRPRGRGGTPAPTVKNIQTGSNHGKLLGPDSRTGPHSVTR
jgi:hypothetical protein